MPDARTILDPNPVTSPAPASVLATKGAPIFGLRVVRRLLWSLIAVEWSRMHRHEAFEQEPDDNLRIDEDGLGFDSLARLELVAVVNRFFQLSDTGIEDYLVVRRTVGEWVALIAHHLSLVGAEARFGFATSGSSGQQKVVVHPRATLEQEVQSFIRLLPSSQTGRILSTVPAHHIYGFLFTVLMPERTGRVVVDLSYRSPSSCLREARGLDLVIGTPFTLGLALASGGRFAPGVSGVTSSAPRPPTFGNRRRRQGWFA